MTFCSLSPAAAQAGGPGAAATGPPGTFALVGLASVSIVAAALLARNLVLARRLRRRERDLAATRERFSALFDNHFQLTGLLDPAGRVVEANAAALALAGVTAADVVGRPFWSCPWWSHDPQLQEQVRVAVGRAAAGEFVRFEASHPAVDGSLRWIDFSLKPVRDAAGRLTYLLPEGRDVTDQHQRDVRFRNLFESAGDAIFVMKQGLFLECNARTLELFRARRDQIVGRTPEHLSPPVQPDGRASGPAAQAHMERARHERRHTFEWQHCRLDGSVFDAEVTLTAHASADQTYMLAIVRDITVRKRLEADLRQAQKMEAIGTLAGGIAHDFNNILAAILGYGELAALQAGDDPELQEHLAQIMKAGSRARDLVQQILAFSRRTVERRQAMDLAPLVAETLRLLRSSIPSTIALRRDLRAAGPVVADPTSLHQVVMNLCTNAYQALAPTGGELAVGVREVEVAAGEAGPAAGSWVVLEVRDDGPGMTAEVRAKIFEPYFTTKDTERGTGLGLAVVHGIVEEHGGHIEVETAPGEGALFRVWLPRRREAPAAPAAAPAAARDLAGDERVLVVDDEPDIVRIADLGLGRYGYRVGGHTDPVQALAAFRADPAAWDVMITDATMPGMTGRALAQAVLALRPDLPVILCTGYAEGLTEPEARAAGIRAVVMKPLTVERLAAEVRAAVRAPAPR